MSDESNRPMGTESFDDEAIGTLVRETAAGWAMPPVRLDAPSWRDRVRSPRERRAASARGWLGRLGQAGTAAIVLTVVAALVAVILTRPPSQVASSPGPSTITTPGATGGPVASPLPKLVRNGDLPSVTNLVLIDELGFFERVELATGSFSLGSPGQGQAAGDPGSAVRRQPDGSVLCLCVSTSVTSGGAPVVVTVRLDRYDPNGSLASTTPIETFTGAPDPRDAGRLIRDQPANVLTAASFSADGRFGFVGWSIRTHPVWHGG
ncbi:MAG: hypothetical protein QOI92_2238, partial [Chloroflexota bacterium]|nr:hypothetical protein [Chloroflexota bacterium]